MVACIGLSMYQDIVLCNLCEYMYIALPELVAL